MRTNTSIQRGFALLPALLGVAVVAALAWGAFHYGVGVILAQQSGPPSDSQLDAIANEEAAAHQGGMSAEEVADLEAQLGSPVDAFKDVPQGPPAYEEPGTIPAEVRELMTDKEMVKLYCSMAKWKTRQFFKTMDALQRYLVPALAQARSLIAVENKTPNFAAMKAEGQRRLDAICAAKNVDQADQLVRDMIEWGRSQGGDKVGNVRDEIQKDMQSKGDAMRQKIQEAIQPIVDAEREKQKEAINAKVKALVDSMKGEFTAAGKAGNKAQLAALRARIDARVQVWVAESRKAVEALVTAKVKEVVGSEKDKYKKVSELMQNVGKQVTDAINAAEPQYDVYRKEAFALRRDAVMRLVDKNIAAGLKTLESKKDQLTAAKQANPEAVTYDEIKASLAKDRAALVAALNANVANGDDASFQEAVDAFRNKWEDFQNRMEDAAASIGPTICVSAVAQFPAARQQMDANAALVNALLDRCAVSSSADCLQVAPFTDRLQTVLAKMSDMKAEMTSVEDLCRLTPVDQAALLDVLRRIQADGEDLAQYGQALEADKDQAMAKSVDVICAQVLPDLEAAQLELQQNDMAALKAYLDKCAGKTTAACVKVNAVRADYDAFVAKVNRFSAGFDQVETICRGTKGKTELESVASALQNLQGLGNELRQTGAELRRRQLEEFSAIAFCRAAVQETEGIRVAAAAGMNQLRNDLKGCKNSSADRCRTLNSLTEKTSQIEASYQSILTKIKDVKAGCSSAGKTPPDDALVARLESLQADKDAIDKAVAEIKAAADKVARGVRVEAESASSFNTRIGVSDPMARELNPTWRPPYFGDGSWYMGRGGDYLGYGISVPDTASYNFWVRDLASAIKSQWGVRVIQVYIDDKLVFTSPENTAGRSVPYPMGAFRWHNLGKVSLTKGQHTLRVVKKASTSGAAILDAYYLTTSDSDVPPEK